MFARTRKAFTAGVGAGLAAGLAALAAADHLGRDTVAQALGAALVAAAITGWSTWRVPNKAPV